MTVLLISFSGAPKVKAWLSETRAPFAVLLDRHRTAYRAYGLRHSFLHSWNARTVKTYGQLLRAGREWRGVQGDSAQLGGDFVIDADGLIRLAHRSRDPVDRPDAATLVRLARELANGAPA